MHTRTASEPGKRLQSLLAGAEFQRFKDIQLTFLERVDSTQTYMAEVLQSDREGDIVIGAIQTKGKGREGRSWVSQIGGLWMTITLKPPSAFPQEEIVRIGSRAITRTLGGYGLTSTLKPPNDVYCNGKKIAGILADSVVQGSNFRVYLGIGVDVNNDISQDASIAEIATSIKKELGRPVDIEEFTVSLLKSLDREYSSVIQSHAS